MANYKKQKGTVKQPFTYKSKVYKKDDVFQGKKATIEAFKKQNLIK